MTQLLPPKKDVALALLERSNVDVHLDPRAKGVVVPPQFRKEPRLVLKIGLNMPVAIPDLRLDDESMSCTLSFSRTPFYCVVPWPSVFAMVGEDGRGMVWPDDVPQELAERVNDRRPGPSAVPSPPPDRAEPVRDAASPKGKGKARVVVAEAPPAGASSASADRADRAGRPKRSKKKKGEEQQRPVLVAVPTPSRESRESRDAREREDAAAEERRTKQERSEEEHPDHAEPAEQAAKESAKEGERETRTVGPVPVPAPAAARSPVSPAPPSPVAPVPGGGATKQGTPNRPKRELPPYLRVVK